MRYEFNPTANQANFENFDKGDYEIIVNKIKAFVVKDGETPRNWGVRVSYTHADNSPYAGKRGSATLYLHNDGSQAMSKRFQMAAYGYPVNAENEEAFNKNEGSSLDWSYDPDTGDVGEGWKNIEGSRLIASMDLQPNKNDPTQMMQQYKGWRPVQTS